MLPGQEIAKSGWMRVGVKTLEFEKIEVTEPNMGGGGWTGYICIWA